MLSNSTVTMNLWEKLEGKAESKDDRREKGNIPKDRMYFLWECDAQI